MLRAQLWQQPQKGKPVTPQIATVQKHFGSAVAKSRVVPPPVGVPGDFKTVGMVDADARIQMIKMKRTRIMALANKPLKRFLELDKTLIIADGDLFEHLAPATMCPTGLFDEMTRADTLICGSHTVIMNLYNFLLMENERRRNEALGAPRIFGMLRVPKFKWPMKTKPIGDPTVFDVHWSLIVASKAWDRQVLFP